MDKVKLERRQDHTGYEKVIVMTFTPERWEIFDDSKRAIK